MLVITANTLRQQLTNTEGRKSDVRIRTSSGLCRFMALNFKRLSFLSYWDRMKSSLLD